MRAAVLSKLNEPLEVMEVHQPDPSGNEVQIRQRYTGICYRDILTKNGFFPRARLPIIPGHEISGIIEKVGPDVKEFRVGQRVASLIYSPCGTCEFCTRGDENLCPNKETYGERLNGAYAGLINVNARSLVPVPEGVGEIDSSIAACVTGMIYNALFRVGRLERGQKVLITGAGGGVGVHAIQIAKNSGAYVIAKTSSPWKRETLLKLGADEVISSENFDREIKEKHHEGVHLALEAVGLPTFERSLRSLKTGGKLVVVGNILPESVPLPLGLIILKGNTIAGSISSTREDVRKVLQMTSEKRLKAFSNKVISLDEVNTAFKDIEQRMTLGRVMIDLSKD